MRELTVPLIALFDFYVKVCVWSGASVLYCEKDGLKKIDHNSLRFSCGVDRTAVVFVHSAVCTKIVH